MINFFLQVLFVLVLSVACTLFCGFSLIYLIGVIQDSLHQLNGCSFDELDRICSCYGPNHKIFKFAENLGCNAVKDKLKELAYGVSILFGVGCLISLATATAAGFLLCRERRNRNHRVVSFFVVQVFLSLHDVHGTQGQLWCVHSFAVDGNFFT